MTEEKYKELFCKEKRIRRRMVLYVDIQTHNLLKNVVRAFRENYVTISSMVDAILWHHLQTNQELLSRLILEDRERSPYFKRQVDDESDSTE